MRVLFRVLAAAATVLVAVVVGVRMIAGPTLGGASGSLRPSLVPPTSASTQVAAASPSRPRFISPIHGIATDYPVGWQVRPATEPWNGGALSFNSPAADVIFDPAMGSDVYLLLASQPTSDEYAWRTMVDRWQCPDPFSSEPAGRSEPSGGVNGHQSITRGCSGTNVATVASLGRGYLIELAVAPEKARDLAEYGYVWLRRIMDTIDLNASEAFEDPTLPQPAFATGTFSTHGADIVLDARGTGHVISGTMEMRSDGGTATVALECSTITEQHFLAIAGTVTREESMAFTPVGTRVMLLFGWESPVFDQGSPVTAVLHTQGTDRPQDASCAAFLATIGDVTSIMEPIVGTLELAL